MAAVAATLVRKGLMRLRFCKTIEQHEQLVKEVRQSLEDQLDDMGLLGVAVCKEVDDVIAQSHERLVQIELTGSVEQEDDEASGFEAICDDS